MNKNCVFETDMADERVDMYKKINNLTEVDGIKVETNRNNGFITTNVEVLNENGSKAISKEIGKYVTMQIENINYMEEEEKKNIVNELARVITELIGKDTQKSVMVLGLGNINVTPDALGPKVVNDVDITRHLINFAKELVEQDTRSVCAIAPGVLGTTGIETSEIVDSIVKKINVDMIIAIDSLASQSVNRLGNTIQISNTGITPGSGINNKREGINKKALGIPVIAIGVPTVVDMATITNETIDKMIGNANVEGNFSDASKEERYNVIAKLLNTENYMVTPKDIDNVIDKVSKLIVKAINLSLQEN